MWNVSHRNIDKKIFRHLWFANMPKRVIGNEQKIARLKSQFQHHLKWTERDTLTNFTQVNSNFYWHSLREISMYLCVWVKDNVRRKILFIWCLCCLLTLLFAVFRFVLQQFTLTNCKYFRLWSRSLSNGDKFYVNLLTIAR